jgi:arylformamidase
MNFIDISWPITKGMTEYKDRATLKIEHFATYESRGFEESTISMGTHTGTHIDAPRHFIEGGKTVNQIDLEQLNGPCQVLDLTKVEEKITKQDLEKIKITPNKIILLKTKNSSLSPTAPFNPNFIYLETSGAEYLANLPIKAVGIDYLGIERNQPDHTTHKAFLNKNIPIIEGLRLEKAINKEYNLTALPLKVEGLEATPARCLLTT